MEFIVPSQSLIEAFDTAQQRHTDAVADLVPLLLEMALASVAEALPGATVGETEGVMNEDWLFTLRIQRVLGTSGEVLYDSETGHDDPEVENRIDEVGFECLDLLLAALGDGSRPTAVAVATLDVCEPPTDIGEDVYEHWGLTHFLLDGHHKVQAAAETGAPITLLSLLALDASLAGSEQVDAAIGARGRPPSRHRET